MSHTGHQTMVCACGAVRAQCRCPDMNKPRVVVCSQCPACKPAYVAPAPQPCPKCGGGKPGVTGKDALCEGCWQREYESLDEEQPIPPATPDAPACSFPGCKEPEPWHGGCPRLPGRNVYCDTLVCHPWTPAAPKLGAGDAPPCPGGCDHSPNDHIDMLVSGNAQLRASNAALTTEVAGLRELAEMHSEAATFQQNLKHAAELEAEGLRERLGEARGLLERAANWRPSMGHPLHVAIRAFLAAGAK